MRKEIEKTLAATQSEIVVGVDQTKINSVIGAITHRSGQVWQD